MCPQIVDRSWILALFFSLMAGCGGAATEETSGALTSRNDGKAPASGSGEPGGISTGPDNLLNAKPLDEISLASDTTLQSTPVAAGAAAGDVCELSSLNIKFCWCPAGIFQMGSDANDPAHLLNESQFEVALSKGFWLQQTEVTQRQYEALMGVNPSYFKGETLPVDSVNWTEANNFCNRLSNLPSEKAAGNLYRLPTEAEWEYACRAGSTSTFCFGDDEAQLEEYAWFQKNSAQTTHPTGVKLPNAWGLHDMHGNVMEWCSDLFGNYPSGSVKDPTGANSGLLRSIRGGSWFFVPLYARSSHRDAYAAAVRYVGLGFRIVIQPAALPTSVDQPEP